MPSTQDPSLISIGAGKLHTDVASAAADLFASISSSAFAGLTASLTQPLATPAVTASFTAGGAESSKVLSTGGPFYVGDSGADQLQDLFIVVNASDDTAIFNRSTQAYVSVTSITGATVGDGFIATNITLNFSTPVPQSTQYKVYYGKRSTLAAMPVEATTNPVIRRSQDRVRFPEFTRTSLAPTSVAEPINIVSNDYPDPYMAAWKGVLRGSPGTLAAATSGTNGFVYIGRKKNVNDANDVSLTGHQMSAFMAGYEKSITASTLAGAAAWTRIDSSTTAVLNPSGAGGDIIELSVNDYFMLTGPGRTAIKQGVDLLELTFSNGIREAYIISDMNTSNTRRGNLKTLGGATPTFSSSTSVTAKWIRMGMHVGGDLDFDAGSFLPYGYGHYVQGAITENPNNELFQRPPYFASGSSLRSRRDSARDSWNIQAFTWGGWRDTDPSASNVGHPIVNGELWGDGTIITRGGRIVGSRADRVTTSASSVANGITVTVNPFTAALHWISMQGAATKNWTVVLDSTTYEPEDGDHITIFLEMQDSGTNYLSTMTWPAEFVFSGSDATIAASPGVTTTYKFVAVRMQSFWYVTRTDYQS